MTMRTWQTDEDPMAMGIQRTDVSPMAIGAQRMGDNQRAGTAWFRLQNSTKTQCTNVSLRPTGV